jgi:antitoxin component of MazEF toxin-antitoxin module
MEIKTVKEGILIPRGILRQLGIENFEIMKGKHEIIIRPKSRKSNHSIVDELRGSIKVENKEKIDEIIMAEIWDLNED